MSLSGENLIISAFTSLFRNRGVDKNDLWQEFRLTNLLSLESWYCSTTDLSSRCYVYTSKTYRNFLKTFQPFRSVASSSG